jgi:hypothetical protein
VSRPSEALAPSRRRRFFRELGAALVLLVALLLAVFGQRWKAARQAVADAVAETDLLDPAWRFEDLEAQRQLPPAERNSALQVLRVKSLLPRHWPSEPRAPEDVEEPEDVWRDRRPEDSPERQLDERQMRWLRDVLGRADLALAEARKLADMPEGRYPIAWEPDIDSTPHPWHDAFYGTKGLLYNDALLQDQDGGPDAALTSERALLNVGRSLGDEPFYHGPSSRLGCRFATKRAIERTLAQGRPSQAALKATQEAVAREDAVSLILLEFRSDRACTHRFLAAVDAGEHRMSEISCVPARGLRAQVETWAGRPEAMRIHARYLRAMNEAVEIAKLPLEQQYPRWQRLRQEKGLFDRVGDGLTLGTHYETCHLHGHAVLRCTVAALAAERYRDAHGDWPRDIADLVPDYLAAVPLDPFDAKPLRFRRVDDGAIVYSVGEDGRDDGGDLTQPPEAKHTPRDVGFRLWNVGQRRQPPKPVEKANARPARVRGQVVSFP